MLACDDIMPNGWTPTAAMQFDLGRVDAYI